MTFDELGLLPEILRALAEAGYREPTPIQAQAIPLVLDGRDVLGGAQTGTGKTAAFTLPLLHRLARHANTSPSPARHPMRALILTPTRELALQVFESVKTYGKYLPLRAACLFGGVDIKPQIEELRAGREIVVATPGRLLDHIEQKTVHFGAVEFLVLDEADRMLDMGFIPDVKRILAHLPKQRQSLLFSATFSDEIKKLADAMLKSPVLVEVARRNTVAETIAHRVYRVAGEDKRALLLHLLQEAGLSPALVFVSTKLGAARLSSWLARQGVAAAAIHGDKSQQERLRALADFKSNVVRVLVATDVAARGLDIEDLPHVINFELPHVAEDYVHRIGRTGRAGKTGIAISLVSSEEEKQLGDIERLIGRRIERMEALGFSPQAHPATRVREGSGHGHPQAARHGPKARLDRVLPACAAHLPQTDNQRPRLGEFDFSKPYEPSPSLAPKSEGKTREQPPAKPLRPVAALLGGLKTQSEKS
ncbi:MAG: DEAD/DEAH box helicase [Rhodocyclaceae bacterium]|nr:DEAD/DEAH box helicase [Rhodocyclaceae bacterium]